MKQSNDFDIRTTPAARTGRMLSIFGFVFLAFVFGGCLSRPSMKTQTFAFSIPSPIGTNNAPEGQVLSIRALQISPPFDGRSLVYRTGDFSYQRDPYAEFLSSPSQELASSISGLLIADRCFGAVVGMGSAAKPDTMVEIYINQLYGDIREPGTPLAVLALQVIFVKSTNDLPGKVILQRSYSRRIAVKSATAAEFMKGWNEALVEIFAEVKSDLRSRENPGTSLKRVFESSRQSERMEVQWRARSQTLRRDTEEAQFHSPAGNNRPKMQKMGLF